MNLRWRRWSAGAVDCYPLQRGVNLVRVNTCVRLLVCITIVVRWSSNRVYTFKKGRGIVIKRCELHYMRGYVYKQCEYTPALIYILPTAWIYVFFFNQHGYMLFKTSMDMF